MSTFISYSSYERAVVKLIRKLKETVLTNRVLDELTNNNQQIGYKRLKELYRCNPIYFCKFMVIYQQVKCSDISINIEPGHIVYLNKTRSPHDVIEFMNKYEHGFNENCEVMKKANSNIIYFI